MPNKRFKVVLAIAGSDTGAGAGIQADIKTLSSLGIYAVTAITALTAQNTQGVRAVQNVDSYFLKEQLDAVCSDFELHAIKIGMTGSEQNALTIARHLAENVPDVPVVLDPVLKSTSGKQMLTGNASKALGELMRRSLLVTPNIDEAAFLTGKHINTVEDMLEAAQIMIENGCQNVLIKGGHLPGTRTADVLAMKGLAPRILVCEKADTKNLHGTGCTLSSAIAAYIAKGQTLTKAVENAVQYVKKAIFAAQDVETGKGNGPLNHFFSPQEMHKYDK